MNILKRYQILFFAIFLIASCKKEDTSLTEKLTFKSESFEKVSTDNIVAKIETVNRDVVLTLEDNSIVAINKSLVKSITEKDWKATITFFDNTVIDLPVIGKDLKFTTQQPADDIPLMGQAKINVPYKGKVVYEVIGQDGAVSNYESSLYNVSDSVNLKIIGLYPDYKNEVHVKYLNSSGKLRASFAVNFQTRKLTELNDTKIDVKKAQNIVVKNEFFLLQFRSNANSVLIDQFGKIRWMSSKTLRIPGYGLQMLKNGNFAIAAGDKIYEYTIYNEVIRTYDISTRYKNIHHDFIELPNGDFICTVDKVNSKTTEDILIQINRKTSDIEAVWDLNLSIPKRYDLIKDTVDWLHINAISYESSTNSIWISGQRSGVFNVSYDNELRYIFSHPQGFGSSSEYLINDPTATYVWGQHNIQSMGNNIFTVFDNGYGRNFSNSPQYSRAVILQRSGNTFNTVWEFGKEVPEYFSPIISGFDLDPVDNSKLICFGSIGFKLTYISNTSQPLILNSNGNYNLEAALVKINSAGVITSQIEFSATSPVGIYRAKIIRL